MIFDLNDISTLAGKKWAKIRLRINHFSRHFTYSCIDVNQETVPFAIAACDNWQRSYLERYGNDPSRFPVISNFIWLLNVVSTHQLEPNPYCFVILVNDTPSGLCLASPISNKCVAVYINIADTAYPGLAEYLVFEIAQRALKDGYTKLNLGHSDLPSTHEFKLKFNPTDFLETFSATYLL